MLLNFRLTVHVVIYPELTRSLYYILWVLHIAIQYSILTGKVAAVAKDSLRLGASSFDAVKHLVLCRLEGGPPRLDLDLYPYLPRVRVSTTSAGDYMTLPSGRAA